MPAPDWENLDAFFGQDDFAVPVTIRRGEVVLWQGSAIFDDGNAPAGLGDLEHDLSSPHLLCSADDVAGVDEGDEAVINGKVWDILSEPERDGTGLARVILTKPNVAFRA